MKFFIKVLQICLLFILIVSLLCSCQNTPNPNEDEPLSVTDASVKQDKIAIGAYLSESMNPLLTRTSFNEQMNLLVYDGLYRMNERYEAVDNLASGYEIKNNGLSVTVHLKPNVSYHDGSTFTAHDVKASIQFIMDHSGYYSYAIRNIKSVTILDDYSVQLDFSYPTPNPKLQLMFPVVCKKDLLGNGDFRLNGTGPYKLLSETKGKQLILKQNENYHGDFHSPVREIEVSLIPDRETANSLSGSGIMDISYAAFYDDGLKTVTKYESLKRDYLTDEYTFLALNFNTEKMQDKKFRKALYKAIPRDTIRDDIFMTHAQSTYLPLPPDSWAYNHTKENQRDLDKAKQLLGEAGYSDVDNDGIIEKYQNDTPQEVVLDILSIDDELKQEMCEAIASGLKEIGISVKIHYTSKEEFESVYQEQKHDLYLITTNIGYDLDLSAFFTGKFSTPVSIDYQSYLMRLSTSDKAELKQPDYMRLCDEFYEYVPHIPLVFLKHTMVTTAKVNHTDAISPTHLYYSVLNQ